MVRLLFDLSTLLLFVACFATGFSISNHLSEVLARTPVSYSNRLCIEFVIADKFGSGFSDARLYIYDHASVLSQFTPNRTITSIDYCYNPDSKVLTEEVDGIKRSTKNYPFKGSSLWAAIQFRTAPPISLIWAATIPQTGETYSGNYLTKMVFRFKSKTASLEFAHRLTSSPLVPITCKSCSMNYFETPSGAYKANLQNKVLTSFTLKGYNNKWFSSDGFGASYEILNYNSDVVYYAGTLCGNDKSNGHISSLSTTLGNTFPEAGGFGLPCDIRLEEGTYIWRVNGALDTYADDVYWEFCGMSGKASMEMFFVIDSQGNCAGGKTRSASAYHLGTNNNINHSLVIPTPTSTRKIILIGVIDLYGIKFMSLSQDTMEVIETALATDIGQPVEVMDCRHSALAYVKSFQEILPDFDVCSDIIQSRTEEFQSIDRLLFKTYITVPDYGPTGTTDEATINVVNNLKRYFELQLSSGVFTSLLRSLASESVTPGTTTKSERGRGFFSRIHGKNVDSTGVSTTATAGSSSIMNLITDAKLVRLEWIPIENELSDDRYLSGFLIHHVFVYWNIFSAEQLIGLFIMFGLLSGVLLFYSYRQDLLPVDTVLKFPPRKLVVRSSSTDLGGLLSPRSNYYEVCNRWFAWKHLYKNSH